MNQSKRERNSRWLGGLILLGMICSSLLHFGVRLTGIHQFDGIAGVMLGLYICSKPAENVLDMLLFGRYAPLRITNQWSYYLWWILNAITLFVGWVEIVAALIRFSGG